MTDRIGNLVVFILLICILAGLVFVIGRGSQLIEQDAAACKAAGGVHVRQYSGFTCLKDK